MPMTPDPPCGQCAGRCCTRPVRYKTLPMITPEEEAAFPEAIDSGEGFKALPLREDGRCIFLTDQNQCSVYERRPQVCREFNCLHGYMLSKGRHGFFLEDHPEVVTLIEQNYPDFVALRMLENPQRPVI